MKYFKTLQRKLAFPLAFVFMFSTLPVATVQAKMIGTDEVFAQTQMSEDRERVMAFVEREDVQNEMQALGVSPEEAKQRVLALSDSELQQVAGKLDEMPAGEGVVGPVIGAFVLVFLVLLFTDILCLTKVYDFTKCSR